MPQLNREFELKLDLTGKELERLAGNPKLHAAGTQKVLRSIYYDTPDHRLHAEGISFRVRKDGQSYVQTVKLGTDLQDGLSNPVEIEDRIGAAQPNPARIHDKRVRRKVQKAVRGSGLTQAFETVVTRTTHRLRTRGSVIELALDRGETLAMNRRSEICEAGLELIKGNPKDLLQAAQSLFAKSGVRLSPVSKAERGYRLLLKKRPAKAIQPVHARAPNIARGQTCGEAFAEILRAAREQIVKNRTAVLETDEPEGAHQLRVGLARLRSAHRALEALAGSPLLRQIETDARTLSRAVGQLRDADVLIGDIYAPFAGNPPRKPGFEALLGALQAHRAAMQKEARAALTGEAWTRLLLSLTLWPSMLERDASLQGPVEEYAGKALQKRWKNSAKLGRSIGSLEGAERHKMRKSLKKLRYTVQFLAPLYGQAKVKPFVNQLKKLQDIFGYVNDVAMAGQLHDICAAACRDEPAALVAAGIVLGQHEAKAAQVWERAPEAWHRLRSSGRFWR
ncbi:MAG: CHAD domain-containing protein [Rhodomicrobium sp.]